MSSEHTVHNLDLGPGRRYTIQKISLPLAFDITRIAISSHSFTRPCLNNIAYHQTPNMNSTQFFFIALSLMVQIAQSFSTPTLLFVGTQDNKILNDRSFLNDREGVSRRNPTALFATKNPSTKTKSTAAPSSTSLYYRDGIEDNEADILHQSVAMTSTTSTIPAIEIPRHVVQESQIESNNDNVELLDSLEMSFGRIAMIVAFVIFSAEIQTGLSISEQFQNLL